MSSVHNISKKSDNGNRNDANGDISFILPTSTQLNNSSSATITPTSSSDIDFLTSSVSVPTNSESSQEKNRKQCPYWSLEMLSKILKTHISRKHSPSTHVNVKSLEGVCVDRKDGIYMVSEISSGFLHPIHV